MFDDLEIMIVLEKTNYKKIYHITYVILSIILLFLIIILCFKYQTYYITFGKVVSGKLELMVKPLDVVYIKKQHSLKISSKTYNYRISEIMDDLYMMDDYSNYQKVVIEVYKLKELDNYVCEVKIPKENKRLVAYILDYFK